MNISEVNVMIVIIGIVIAIGAAFEAIGKKWGLGAAIAVAVFLCVIAELIE